MPVERLGTREIEAKRAEGFLVRKKPATYTIWADAETGLLVRMECEVPPHPETGGSGGKVTWSDFVYDVELDESLFSLEPPLGYSDLGRAGRPPMPGRSPNPAARTEEDLIAMLRVLAERDPKRRFPQSIDARVVMDIYKTLPRINGKLTEESAEMITTQQRGVLFAPQLPPESGWRYLGGGVELGESGTPVCWWKFTAVTYRVVYGDLTVRGVRAADLPAADE